MIMTPDFHYPPEIVLKTNPLSEAWLTIQWELEPLQPDTPFSRDPNFPYALGHFYDSVKDEFGYRQEREEGKIPIELIAHRPRYQFRSDENGWPLLQLGPGVATVNYTEPYTWAEFKETALYLRDKLVKAYEEQNLESKLISLRYRNAVPCAYSSSNLLEFLSSHLNTRIQMPDYIPGNASIAPRPSTINFNITYDIIEPKSIGILRITTGTKKVEDQDTHQISDVEHMIFELEIQSGGDDSPTLTDESDFAVWLDSAHRVVHDWFFSLIEGPLRNMYQNQEE
jgi:uncharacterized protein (TIGR04255 family)